MAGKKNPKKRSEILIFLLIILAIILVLNLFLNLSIKTDIRTPDLINTENNEKIICKSRDFLSSENSTLVIIEIPAIDAQGNGVTTSLSIEVFPGTGRTLVEIENLLFWADTQHSIRVARMVAGNITQKNVDDYDMIYTLDANATIIGGPSAGTALTIATIAALEQKEPNKSVMITGSINSDGSIGPVSAILEKAKASKNAGADIFLVPLLQSRDVIYETVQSCETYGVNELCVTETRPKKVNIKEEVGIEVIEISTVREALDYFFEE